ncbi:MAG: hypothetical protein JXA28_05110 [Bacteroidetes bacterium]|nr:hypothetical protein [Bacteroidota bacterium]
MSLNELTTLVFSVLTLVFAVWGFALFAKMANRVIRALDIYIGRNQSLPEKDV